jgi:Flp pilus assembly pilin Flp
MQSGQAVIEYAFLMVLLATAAVAVIVLAGTQLQGTLSDVSYELTHVLDSNTVGPNDQTILGPGETPAPGSCPPGQTAQRRGHKWKCRETS